METFSYSLSAKAINTAIYPSLNPNGSLFRVPYKSLRFLGPFVASSKKALIAFIAGTPEGSLIPLRNSIFPAGIFPPLYTPVLVNVDRRTLNSGDNTWQPSYISFWFEII